MLRDTPAFFVWLFFGGFFSYFYYLYLLLVGAAIAATWGPSYRYVACILALMAAEGRRPNFRVCTMPGEPPRPAVK